MAEPAVQTSPTRGVSYLYMAAAFVIVVAGMRAAESILNPLLLAVFLAIISSPAYFALLKRKFSNWLALLIVIGVLSAIALGLAFAVTESIVTFAARQQHYREQLNERTHLFQSKFLKWFGDETDQVDSSAQTPFEVASPTETISEPKEPQGDAKAVSAAESEPTAATGEEVVVSDETVLALELAAKAVFDTASVNESPGWGQYIRTKIDFSELVNRAGDFALGVAIGILVSIPQMLSNAFLILLTVIFILLEASTFQRKIRKAFTDSNAAADRAQEIIGSMQEYIVIKTWISLGTGILIAIWLWFFSVPYFALWGLLAFLFNYIPNIGSVIAAVPAVLIAWLDLSALPAAAAAIGFILVNGVVGNFIEPRIMGKGLGLSPLVVFFSMVFWGWVLGPVGMLLSVPLTMTARIALEGFEDTRWVAILLGNAEVN